MVEYFFGRKTGAVEVRVIANSNATTIT